MSGLLFAIVIAITAVGPLTLHLALPAFPAIQHDLGASLATLQLAVSVAMLTMAFATLLYGPLSDRFGRRPVLLGGLALFTLGSVICTIAPNITALIIGRFVQAAGAGCGTVLGRTIMADVYSRERLAGMLGYMVAAYTIAPALAAPLGGNLSAGFGWRSVFGFAAIAGAAIFIACVFLLAESNKHPATGRSLGQLARGNLAVMRLPNFLPFAMQMGFGGVMFFAFLSAAPHLVIDLQGRSSAEYGTYFLFLPLGYLIGSLATGRLGSRFASAYMVLAGSAIAAFSVIVMAVWETLDPTSTLAFFVCVGVMVMGGGISTPHAQASGVSRAGSLAGTASGMLVFVQWGMGALAAQLVGMIADGTARPVLVLLVLASLCSTGFAVIAVRNARAAAP